MSCGRRDGRKSIWPFGNSTCKPYVADATCDSETKQEEVLRLNPKLRIFSFNEIKFSRLVGRAGVTTLYKGSIRDVDSARSIPVAVKKLNHDFFIKGHTECRFKFQMRIIGRPHLPHPNIEKFLGFGCEDGQMFFVYEFMKRGSFKDHLSPPRGGGGSVCKALPWDTRLKIVMEAARALESLHSSGVLYKETFKASDILLDESYNVKLSGGDLARIYPIRYARRFDGCDPPEYCGLGVYGVKSNVYNFGVVLVQVLTGGRPLSLHSPNHLVKWPEPEISDKLVEIIDPRLKGVFCYKSAARIALLAKNCLQWEVNRRPSMKQVVHKLHEIIISK